MTYCRIKEINEQPLSRLPWMTLHHTKVVTEQYKDRMQRGVVTYIEKGDPWMPEGDDLFHVADLATNIPEMLRNRLDGTFAGLERLQGGVTKYRACFDLIEAKWLGDKKRIFNLTMRDAERRLELCMELVLTYQPRFERYLNKLLEYCIKQQG